MDGKRAMEKKTEKVKPYKKTCQPFFVLLLLALCMAACAALTGCGHDQENRTLLPESHSTQQEAVTVDGQTNPGAGLKSRSDAGSAKPGLSSGNQALSGAADPLHKDSSGKTVRKEIYGTGDSLQDGDLRITYTASGEYHEESEYLQPPAGQKYIFLEYAFENTSEKEECQVSLFAFQCFADGFAAPAYYGGVKELPSSLSAGRCAVGDLYFSVPEDAEKIEVEYQPDDPASGKVRFSYEGEKDSGYMPKTDPRRTQGAFRPGETAVSDLQRIVYLSCQADDSDNENVHPAEGCTYWTLAFEFENLREEDRQISVHDFSCYADGKSCGRTLFRDDYLSADIPGGRKAKGTVTFEVPDDAQTVEVEYDTGRRSDAHVVFTVR